MTRRSMFLPLLFLLGVAAAQNTAPATPEGVQSEKLQFCGGIVNPPCTTPPRQIYSPDTEYPKKNSKVRLPGTVQLTLVVSPDGLTRDITVFRSLSPEFDVKAIDAVKQWKFYPATRDGMRVATKIHVEITFSRR